MNQDLIFMKRAILQAQTAYEEDEVPVGAVLVKDGEIIAESYNQLIQLNDPTSHAEINVIRKASKILGNYRLNNTSLYVTLEPCLMCCGAMIHARIENLIFSTKDPKSGAVVSNARALDYNFINHKVRYSYGPLKEECSNLLKKFFSEKRL
ncbi:MAG: tRNA adenosine(34) deaminase TadA [Gammaproteobacteria bacterium]